MAAAAADDRPATASSDTSDPVLVSAPNSPTTTNERAPATAAPGQTTGVETAAAPTLAPLATAPADEGVGRPLTHEPSPIPPPKVVKDTASETITTLDPSPARNTTQGLGRPGDEELGHLNAPPVMGGAQGVVGEAAGLRPEWIARVKKVKEPEDAATKEVGPEGSKGAATVEEEDGDDDEARSDKASGQSKWLKKVKVGVASIKEKAKDVRDSAASSISSSTTRDRSDSTASSAGGSLRARSRSLTGKSAVGFDVPEDGEAPTPAPVKPVVTRVITDFEGTPVPTDIGPTKGGTPTTSLRDEPAANSQGAALAPPPSGANASTTTSVKDKILESHDVDVSIARSLPSLEPRVDRMPRQPRTTNEKFHSLFKEIPDDEELIEGALVSPSGDCLQGS
jgi:hypothetical protein